MELSTGSAASDVYTSLEMHASYLASL